MGNSRRLFKGAKSLLCSIACLPMLALGTSADTANKAESTVKIGFITHLTGVAAAASQDMLDGMQLYLDQIHNTAGGKKIELVIANDQADKATSQGLVHKLVETDHCQILDGIILGHIGYVDAVVAEKAHVPLVLAVAASDDITQRLHYDWVVRTGWSSSQPSHPFGEYAAKKLHYHKIVTLGMDYPFGWEVVGGFQKSFEAEGGKVVQKLWAPLGFQEFTSVLNQIDQKADALFLVTSNQAANIVPREYQKLGIKLPVIAGGTSLDESVLPHLGDEVLGWLSVSPYSAALNNPANKRFVAAFEARYKRVPSWFAEGGYTSGMWIVKAVNNLKGDVSNNEKLLAALKKVELSDAPRGPIKLDAYNNPIQNIYVRKVTRVGGKLQNTVIDTFHNVSQFGDFKPEEFLKQPVYSKDYPACANCK